jgi:phosphate-selective porin OprO and OprP
LRLTRLLPVIGVFRLYFPRLSPLAALGFGLLPLAGFAQSEESDLAPDYQPPADVETFAIPDVPDATLAAQNYENRRITMKLGLAVLADYTAFSQDANSLAQVGKQEDKSEFRSFRFMVRGDLKFLSDWKYFISAEYKGFGQNDGASDWSFGDVTLSHELWSKLAKISIGKMKEPFVYEMVGDAANLPQQERILSPFFVSRNWGIRVSDVILDKHATLTVGVFNDWLIDGEEFSTSGTQVSGRFTWLPVWSDDGKNFLHLAASFRYNGGDNDTLRFRGRPESNVADYYVDTGDIVADHAWEGGLEALWNQGPYSVLAEYVRARVSSALDGDPGFSGWYVTGSWVLTGETRPYDRNVAYARRVLPTKRWGAPELVARYSHVDLDDGAVQGGTMNKTYLGINWWATKRWKAGFGWGRTWLDRYGVTGRTDSFLTRLQWIH